MIFLPDSFLNFHYFIRLLCVMVLLTIYWIQCCTSRQKWISAMFTSEWAICLWLFKSCYIRFLAYFLQKEETWHRNHNGDNIRKAHIAFFQSTRLEHSKLGMLHCHLGDKNLHSTFTVELRWRGEIPQQSQEIGSNENFSKIQCEVHY